MAQRDLEPRPNRSHERDYRTTAILHKRQVTRADRGSSDFDHYRLRVLVHGGGATWPNPIGSLSPPLSGESHYSPRSPRGGHVCLPTTTLSAG